MPKKAASGAAKRKSAGPKPKKKAATRPRRKPAAKTAKRKPRSSPGRLRVKQIRSGLGHAETYRRTLRALGLKHHQAEVILVDNASVRGMLHKVRHLVRVTEEKA